MCAGCPSAQRMKGLDDTGQRENQKSIGATKIFSCAHRAPPTKKRKGAGSDSVHYSVHCLREIPDVVVYPSCLAGGGPFAVEFSCRGRVAEGLIMVEFEGFLCSMLSCTYRWVPLLPPLGYRCLLTSIASRIVCDSSDIGLRGVSRLEWWSI